MFSHVDDYEQFFHCNEHKGHNKIAHGLEQKRMHILLIKNKLDQLHWRIILLQW